uniref:SET domain-containing protein n=1 Tax=Prymnesium polylepis TaxID=72548 RepID=A0A7S4HCS0_9EUKA
MSLAEVEELMEGLDYSIQPSEGKSLGLFALRPLGPGSVVGFYSGPIVSDAEYDDAVAAGRSSGDYGFALGNGFVVDAEDPTTSGPLRFCNHSGRRPNCEMGACKLFGKTYGVFLETSKDINAGDELLFDYGGDFWSGSIPADD